jgi:hypothetical protein
MEIEDQQRWNFEFGGSKVSVSVKPSVQVWGANENAVTPEMFLHPVILQTNPADSLLLLCQMPIYQIQDLSCFLRYAFSRVVREGLFAWTTRRERVLDLARGDKSKPKALRIRVGAIRELADGVFAKKRSDGILEIYVSEE